MTPRTARLGDFSAQADAYRRARPPYPDPLLDNLIAELSIEQGAAVADLGAGTGILTEQLAQRGLSVTAVEPNAKMSVLAGDLPGVRWIEGSFEESELDDGSQRWVVAAQAFHWADPPRALPEMRRVLAADSAFTVMWNNRENDAHPVLAWTFDAIHRYVPGFDDNYRQKDWAAVLTSDGSFSKVTYHEQRHAVPMSRARYIDLWRSHHRLTTLAGPQQFPRFIEQLTLHLEKEGIESVDVPYLCRSWTVS